MKQKLTLLILTLLVQFIGFSQVRVGINYKLLRQLGINQTVRMGSNQYMMNSFRKQSQVYNYVDKKVTESIVIHNYIYDKLRNVNTTLKQGKKVKYTTKYLAEIVQNSGKLLQHTIDNPEIAITLHKYYSWVVEEALAIKDELNNVVLKGKDGILMDTYDRGQLIDKIYSKVRSINGGINYICLLIEDRKSKSLLYYLPGLGNYAVQDKQLVEDIFNKWELLKI